MATFKQKLLVEYPIPQEFSCWGERPGYPAIEDLDVLIETAVDEMASDLHIVEHKNATGMVTLMPEGTITCTSAMLSSSYVFQGNRLVKVTYDKSSRKAFLRYYPAVITYTRKLTVDDLSDLVGDRLIYIKSYCLWKMAEKELFILKAATMQVDNGQIDLQVLSDFANSRKARYEALKDEILMYATVN